MKNKMLLFMMIFFINFTAILCSQDISENGGAVFFRFIPDPDFKIIMKENLRIKRDRQYIGSVFRESRILCRPDDAELDGHGYRGKVYVFEELKHEGRLNAKRIDNVSDTGFVFFENGKIETDRDSLYPLLRDFPVFLTEKGISEGEKWQEFGEVYTDPLKKGIFTKIKFICEYRYDGIKDFNGSKVHAVYAQYAVRYKSGDDPEGDPDLISLSGSHKVMIYIQDPSGGPFFIQDNIDELYSFRDTEFSQKGFSHTWYKTVSVMDRKSLSEDIAGRIAENKNRDIAENITLEERSEGISLTLKNIRFFPDQAVILPGEEVKIDFISELLREIPERSFLITGHTADIGSEESQLELSVKRAQVIAEMLTAKGISGDRLIFMGKGGSEPVASNETEEGRSLNRRVEIIILED